MRNNAYEYEEFDGWSKIEFTEWQVSLRQLIKHKLLDINISSANMIVKLISSNIEYPVDDFQLDIDGTLSWIETWINITYERGNRFIAQRLIDYPNLVPQNFLFAMLFENEFISISAQCEYDMCDEEDEISRNGRDVALIIRTDIDCYRILAITEDGWSKWREELHGAIVFNWDELSDIAKWNQT